MQIGTATTDYSGVQEHWDQQALRDRRRKRHLVEERRALRNLLQDGYRLARPAPGVAL